MHSVSEKLGGVVKAARLEKHFTQKQLAERLSITPHYIMSIERRKKIPSSELLFRIIRELDISADTIFYPTEGRICELVDRLHILLRKCEEHDIEFVIAILQTLLQEKCLEGGDPRCLTNCPYL